MTNLTAPETVGMDPRRLDELEQLFRGQIESGLHPGAGLAVYRYGKPVLDIHGGVADSSTRKTVGADTMFALFSSTKPLAAVCMYILKERGKLDWDDPVARLWPEFAQHGEDAVTIRHILTHRGGFPETPADLLWFDWTEW